MGKINNVINKMRFKNFEKLNNDGTYVLAEYKNSPEKVLLYNGKVVCKNVTQASTTMQLNTTDKILHLPIRSGDKLYLFNNLGKNLTPCGLLVQENNSLPQNNNQIYGTVDGDEIIVHNINRYKNSIIINKNTLAVSPHYAEVKSYNENGYRRIRFNNDIYFYINKNFEKTSGPFLKETEPDENGNTIRSTFNAHGDGIEAIFNNNNRISKYYDNISHQEGTIYLATECHSQKCTYLNKNGQPIATTNKPYTSRELINLNYAVCEQEENLF